MEITYKWDCTTVEVNYEQEGESNVVYLIHWSLDGVSTETNEDGNFHTVSIAGSKEIPLNPDTEFVAFEDLTNEILTNWTKEAFGEEEVAELYKSIEWQMDDIINPKSYTAIIGGSEL
jgi:hypothetical protein